MPDSILPHGGELIDRTVADATGFPTTTTPIPVTDADLSTLYGLADDGLPPLHGR